jgi:hypothetical protein
VLGAETVLGIGVGVGESAEIGGAGKARQRINSANAAGQLYDRITLLSISYWQRKPTCNGQSNLSDEPRRPGGPASRRCWTHSFASPPCDGFAFIGLIKF